MEVTNHPTNDATTHVVDDEPFVNRGWFTTADGRKHHEQISSSKGIIDDALLPNITDRREIKIVVYGKAGVGKTSVIANLCEIPSTYVETSGVQVLHNFWPVQLTNNKLVLLKYKYWDCGATGIKKYTYLAQAYNVEPKVVIFVFSITDRDSYDDLVKQLEMKSGTSGYQKVVKIVIGTKNDYALQSQVTRSELAELSAKCQIPIYLVKNLANPSPADQCQNEKDMMKIKNDLADYLLAADYRTRKESRFKITTKSRKIAAIPPSPRPSSEERRGSVGEVTDAPKRRDPIAITESHSSYELVYDMLIGIKNAVVESYAKRASREEELELNFKTEQIALLPKDFTMYNRYHYTTKGVVDENDKVVSQEQEYKYSFKFVDHAPFVFNNIRSAFGFDTADYLETLTKEISLYELQSPGKSGAFFYFSLDYKFIIKTVTETEAEFFKTFLQNYYQFLMNNPNTLLVKFFGFYMVQPRGVGKEMYFIVMENAFPPDFKIDETYDLKGSTVGRFATEQEKGSGNAILKDLDITRVILIGNEAKKKLIEQMDKDAKLLAENNIMDYSFLLGVHLNYKPREQEPVDENNPKKSSFQKSFFKKDDGGIKSSEKDELYFLLVIDIFTTWGTKKKLEHSMKSLIHDSAGLSAVDPLLYKDRFCNFMGALIH